METVKKVTSALGRFFLINVTLPLLGVIALFLFTFYLTISYARKNPEPFGLVKGPTIIQKEQEAFVKRVGTSIELPSEEIPTIATVTDLEKLGNQPFFKNAQLEDKVLIYTNAGKVILYRPGEDRVVEVGTVNISEDSEGLEKDDEGQEESEEEEIVEEDEVIEEESPSPEPTPEEVEVEEEEAN